MSTCRPDIRVASSAVLHGSHSSFLPPYDNREPGPVADLVMMQVEPQEKKKTPKGRAKKRITYTRRFVNVTMTGGKRKVWIHSAQFSVSGHALDSICGSLSKPMEEVSGSILTRTLQMNPNPTT